MGNQGSSLKIDHDRLLRKTINDIAAKYILTQNFQDMIALKDPEVCSNLVIITSEIIKESLNWRSVLYLDQFLKGNKVINKMAKENLLYLNKADLNDLDVESGVDKRRMCIGISKFYIKINMLFAAIATTIRPIIRIADHLEKKQLKKEERIKQKEKLNESSDDNLINEDMYVDDNDDDDDDDDDDKSQENKDYNLENKDLLLGDEEVSVSLSEDSLCGKRILALISKNNYDPAKKSYTINPNLCKFFEKQDGKNLYQEPGIPELEALFKDNFDYQTGNFLSSLTKEGRKEYQDAIDILYKAFTGKSNSINSVTKTPNAQRFSDIKLQDYDIGSKCDDDGVYTQIFKGNSPIFREYVKRIQKMIDNNKNYNSQLVQILKQVFKIDKSEYPYIVTLNPDLNEIKLDQLIQQTRKILVNLYSTCEKDFMYVLEIYNELITSKTIKSVGYNKSQSLKNNIAVISNNEANKALEEPSFLENALEKSRQTVMENLPQKTSEDEMQDVSDKPVEPVVEQEQQEQEQSQEEQQEQEQSQEEQPQEEQPQEEQPQEEKLMQNDVEEEREKKKDKIDVEDRSKENSTPVFDNFMNNVKDKEIVKESPAGGRKSKKHIKKKKRKKTKSNKK